MEFESAFREILGSSEASLQKVKRMLDVNPSIAFIQHAGDQRLIYLSPKAESILGEQIQDVLQGTVDLIARVHPEDLLRLQAVYQRLPELSDDECTQVEFRFKPEGPPDWRWLRCQCSVLERSPEGAVKLLIGYCQDITDQKIAGSGENGNLTGDAFQMGQSQLYQAAQLASIGQLASTLAHQLYNPLSTVIAEAQLLGREPNQSESARASSNAIMEAGWRAQRVIEVLLLLSQPPRDIRIQVSISKTIHDALSLMESHFKSPAIELSIDLPENLEIVGNPQQITDLWINLLLVPFLLTDGSKISQFKIQAQSIHDKVVTFFKNNGMQLTPEEAEHIFEPKPLPFNAENGHGLELTICREIVRQHGGSLSTRQEGEFIVFEVAFQISGAI